jgi:hypothetical protein
MPVWFTGFTPDGIDGNPRGRRPRRGYTVTSSV